MKKMALTIARTEEAGGDFTVKAWRLEVPGLAAWNRPKNSLDWTDTDGVAHSKVIHKNWALIHIATGKHITSARKRDDLVEIATRLAPICDWTQLEIDSTFASEALTAIWRYEDDAL